MCVRVRVREREQKSSPAEVSITCNQQMTALRVEGAGTRPGPDEEEGGRERVLT